MTAQRLGDLAVLAGYAAAILALAAVLVAAHWPASAPGTGARQGGTSYATTRVCGVAPCR